MFLEEGAGKLHRDELVMFTAAPEGGQSGSALMVEDDRARREIDAATASFENGVARQIQAKLHALGVKAARPIKISRVPKVVPFEAESDLLEPSKQRTPAFADRLPGGAFGKGRRAGLGSLAC